MEFSFLEFFKEVVDSHQFTAPIYNKICLWLIENLEGFELETGKNLYYHYENYRKRRPFISVFCKGNTFAVIVLSTSNRNHQKSVDISLCDKTNCSHFPFVERSFIYRTKKDYLVIPMSSYRLKILESKGTVKWCGCCENLERLKNFCNRLGGSEDE